MFAPERQPTSFKQLIQEISTTLSLTVIGWMIEEYRILFDEVPEQKDLLDQLLAHSTDLDAVQWLCARYLGNTQQAVQIRQWMDTRDQRPKRHSVDEP